MKKIWHLLPPNKAQLRNYTPNAFTNFNGIAGKVTSDKEEGTPSAESNRRNTQRGYMERSTVAKHRFQFRLQYYQKLTYKVCFGDIRNSPKIFNAFAIAFCLCLFKLSLSKSCFVTRNWFWIYFALVRRSWLLICNGHNTSLSIFWELVLLQWACSSKIITWHFEHIPKFDGKDIVRINLKFI